MQTSSVRTKESRYSEHGTDSLQAYLRTVRAYPLLSREEEYELALRYNRHSSEAAAVQLVNSNLRLVVKIAHEYRAPQNNLLDLIQEGNLGLIYAVRRFDPDRQVRLSSYAQWWIRAYILKYLMDNHRLVKVGTTQAQRKLYYNLNRAREQLLSQGQEPTIEALALYLDVKERDVIEMDLRLNLRDVRMNAPIDDDASAEQGDLMASDEPLPEELVADQEFWNLFEGKLHTFQDALEGRDVMIWKERLVSEEPTTLRELAGRFGVSRERVRQLEARIVRKLCSFIQKELALDFELSPNFDLLPAS
jgi:RNA polymerase sigma-32 factor